MVQEDVAADLIPLLVVGTYGTTSCGGVDDIAELCRLCSLSCLKLPMWMHVDAAYAGSALLCPEYQEDMPDLGRVDSFNFNPHKWMMTNFDVSALWFVSHSLGPLHLSLSLLSLSLSVPFFHMGAADRVLILATEVWGPDPSSPLTCMFLCDLLPTLQGTAQELAGRCPLHHTSLPAT